MNLGGNVNGFIWRHSPGLRWLSNRLGGNSGNTQTNYPVSNVPLGPAPIPTDTPNFAGYGIPPVNRLTGGGADPATGQIPLQNVPLAPAGIGHSGNDFKIQGLGPPRIGGGTYQGGGSPTLGAQGQVDPSQWGQLVSMAWDTRNKLGDTNSTYRRG